jgi:hypothetical protein
MRRLDRLRADRGQIGSQLLTRLGAFDKDATRPAGKPAMAAQLLRALEQPVRPLDALQGDGAAANGDGRLADVERADGFRSGTT